MKNMQSWLNSKGRDLEVAMFNTIALNDDKINVLYTVSLFVTDEGGFAAVYGNDALPNICETYNGLKCLIEVGFRQEENPFYNEIVRNAFTYLFKQKDLTKSDYYPAILAMGNAMLKNQNQNHKKCHDNLDRVLHEYMKEMKPSLEKIKAMVVARLLVEFDNELMNKLNDDIYNVIEKDIEKWDDSAILPLQIFNSPIFVTDKNKEIIKKNLELIEKKRLSSGVWYEANSSDINMVKLSGVLTIKNLMVLKNFKRI